MTVFSRTQKFQPDVEIIQKSVDGRIVKNVFNINGNKLIEKQIDDKTVTIYREFFDDELVSTSVCDDIVSKTLCRLTDD